MNNNQTAGKQTRPQHPIQKDNRGLSWSTLLPWEQIIIAAVIAAVPGITFLAYGSLVGVYRPIMSLAAFGMSGYVICSVLLGALRRQSAAVNE